MRGMIAALAAAVAVVSWNVAVYASGSPTELSGYDEAAKEAVGNIDTTNLTAVDAAGSSLTVKVYPVSGSKYLVDEETADGLAIAAVESGLVDVEVGENEELVQSVLGLVDIKVSGTGTIQYPITLTIPVSGVNASDSVVLLHYVDGAWETIAPVRVGEEYVVARFDSLSPVAVVLLETVPIDEDESEYEDSEDEEGTESDDGIEEDSEELEDSEDTEDTGDPSEDKKNDTKTPKDSAGNRNTTDKKGSAGSGKRGSSAGENSGTGKTARTISAVSPKTGDTELLVWLGALFVLSALGTAIVAAVLLKKKRHGC